MATLKNLTVNDTGFVRLPQGTTAQRPASPVAGQIRFNTDYNRNEVYNGSAWVLLEHSQYATGGTVTTSGGYRIHTFTSGATTFTMTYPGTVEVLMVGGGGGGAQIGGGGGAGGFVYESGTSLPAGNYTITVGTGGSGETQHNANNQNPGNPSSFVGPGIPQMYNAIGGGQGATYSSGSKTLVRNCNGGSGGGGPGGHTPGAGGEGGWYPQAPGGHGNQGADHPWLAGMPNATLQGTPTGNNNDHISMEGNGYGSGTVGQGHPGGFGAHGGGFGWVNSSNTIHCGGGGGGAGASGKPTSSGAEAGSGGTGLAAQISGTLTRYAGGGGAGTHSPGGYGHYGLADAQGGGMNAFGGGKGGNSGAAGVTGTTNTGGGGGGGYWANTVSGGGGPGIVIVRYRDQ